MNYLVVIPARKNSKGVPGKNKRLLGNKPLIQYTIEAAKEVFSQNEICISTDDDEIIQIAADLGVKPAFKRPDELSTDTASSQEVLVHALEFYEKQGKKIDTVVLLQVTSPFRKGNQIKEALQLFNTDIDMVVSVTESKSNPYFNLFEENEQGFLEKSKQGNFTRRQDSPSVFEYNGAIYIINRNVILEKKIGQFQKVVKYVMDEKSSIDIDTNLDWKIAELLLDMKN